MMRLIAILLSVMMLVSLTYTFISQDSLSQLSEQSSNSSKLIIPAYISDTPLEVEKVWQQLKADRIKAELPTKDKMDSVPINEDVLTVGDNRYVLYGIFNAGNESHATNNGVASSETSSNAFILIKTLKSESNKKKESSQMRKVVQGEVLSKDVILFSVTSNSISFKQNDELIKFNLFEAKK
jgi:hypothetical protein